MAAGATTAEPLDPLHSGSLTVKLASQLTICTGGKTVMVPPIVAVTVQEFGFVVKTV